MALPCILLMFLFAEGYAQKSSVLRNFKKVSILKLKSEAYNDLEKGFSRTLKGGLKQGIEIDTYASTDNQQEIESLLFDILRGYPDMVVTMGSSPSKYAAPILAGRDIPMLYLGVTYPELVGLKCPVPERCYLTGIRWGISLKSTFKLFREVAPRARKVAFFYAPHLPADVSYVQGIKEIQDELDFEVTFIPLEGRAQLLALPRGQYDFISGWYGMLLMEPTIDRARIEVIERMRVPFFAGDAQLGEKLGAVVSVGANIYQAGAQGARLAARILKGEPAGRIPAEEPERIQIIVNLKMARKFGIKIPIDILESADKVITK